MRCQIACEIAHETKEDGKRWRNFSWLCWVRKKVKNSTLDLLRFPPASLMGFVPSLSTQISFKDPNRTMWKFTLRASFSGLFSFPLQLQPAELLLDPSHSGACEDHLWSCKTAGKFGNGKETLEQLFSYLFFSGSCLARRGCAYLGRETPELLGDKGKERKQKAEMRVKHQRQPHPGTPAGN